MSISNKKVCNFSLIEVTLWILLLGENLPDLKTLRVRLKESAAVLT
jgi:hypothetical protein